MSTEDDRRQALRKAGEEYFEKILAGNKASVPLVKPELPPKRTLAPGTVTIPVSGYQPKGDADFQAMGNFIERYRDLVVAVFGVSALGAAYALARQSLKFLPAPAMFTSIHFVIFSIVIFLLDRGHVFPFELKTIDLETLSACAPSTLIHALFVTTLFFSLGNNSVAFSLSWCAVMGETIRAVLERLGTGSLRDGRRLTLLVVGVLGLVGCYIGQIKINASGLVYLSLLSLSVLLEALWDHANNPASHLDRMVGAGLASTLRTMAAKEKGINASNLLLARNVLPILPIAGVALVLGENKVLASSNATVPLLSAAILSVCFFTFGQSVVFYLNEIGTNKRHVSILVYLGFIVGVAVDAAVRQKGSAYLAAGSAALAILAATVFRILSHRS